VSYTVEYIELKNGENPFEIFVMGLSIQERAKLFETINYFLHLKNHHLPIKENLSKHLEDGIFELRTFLIDKIARSLFFYEKEARIVITHGFLKKTQKTPRKEIEKAKTLRNLYHE